MNLEKTRIVLIGISHRGREKVMDRKGVLAFCAPPTIDRRSDHGPAQYAEIYPTGGSSPGRVPQLA
jgi:hypothetical protein